MENQGKVGLQPYIDRVVAAIGRAGPTVTPNTKIASFYRGLSRRLYTEEINHLHGMLGVVVQRGDSVVDVAERLANDEKPPPEVNDMTTLLPFA